MAKANSTRAKGISPQEKRVAEKQFYELIFPFCALENIGEVLRQGRRQTFMPETLGECIVVLSTTILHALSEIKVEGTAKKHSVAAAGLLRKIIEAGRLFPDGEPNGEPKEYVAIGAAIERLVQLLAIELNFMGAAVGLTPVVFWLGSTSPEEKEAA